MTNFTHDQPEDSRYTLSLLADVFRVLEQHGYRQPLEGTTARNVSTSNSMVALRALTIAFEGGDR